MATGPELNIPKGAVASIQMIDTTSGLSEVAVKYVVEPPVPGIANMPYFPCWSFLVENPGGRKILFDLGIRKDWHNYAPIVSNRLKASGWNIKVEKNVIEILQENGLKGEDFEAVVWSHWHWDHIGDASTFPKSVNVIVGPGFKKEFLPGYPTGKNSSILESDYELRRELIELDFTTSSTHKIGRMNALDYFGDGSFYILDTPGHAIGHLSGLVRTTTNPDTFIVLGGDAIHHGGELRPSQYLPIPASIDLQEFPSYKSHRISACPGHLLEELQTSRGRNTDEAFFIPAMGHDIPETIRTVGKLQETDWNEDFFFIFAHDGSLVDAIDKFPKYLNDWKDKGWAAQVKWLWLEHLMPALKLK